MKQQRLKQVIEEELQKLLSEQGAQMRSLDDLHGRMRRDQIRQAEHERTAAELGLTDEVPAQRPRSEDHVGRQIRVQSTPGAGGETKITSPGSRTITRTGDTMVQQEPMTFNVRPGARPKESTYQPPSIRVRGGQHTTSGLPGGVIWGGASESGDPGAYEESWYETYFGAPQKELVGDIAQGIA